MSAQNSTTAIPVEPAADADVYADLSKLRMSQSFEELAGAKKVLTTVRVGKPDDQTFVRVHGSPEYRMDLALLEMKEEERGSNIYLVLPHVAATVPNEVHWATVYTAITRQGDVFLWRVKKSQDKRGSDWARSAREAAERAIVEWVRVKANMGVGAYEYFLASGTIPDPEWPAYTFNELLRVAFGRERLVDRPDHPILKKLRGE
jgi:hypothetical protein